jgi:peptide/nickel transport system permease protein
LLRARLGVIGLILLALVVAAAVFAPQVAPDSPTRVLLSDRLLPPLAVGDDRSRHLLGTDQLGRDVWSRILYGTRISLFVGAAAVAQTAVIGVTAGVLAGFRGGPLDAVVMRFVDLQLAFPFFLLALAVVALLGPSLRNVIIVFVITGWPVYARTTRASVLVVRSHEYVGAARSLGASGARIVVRHVLPNILAPVLVLASYEMARVIIAESAMGFLGLGVPPPAPTWGNMLAEGREYMQTAWWLSTFPGLAIVVVGAAVNFVGDALRDTLDPRMR